MGIKIALEKETGYDIIEVATANPVIKRAYIPELHYDPIYGDDSGIPAIPDLKIIEYQRTRMYVEGCVPYYRRIT